MILNHYKQCLKNKNWLLRAGIGLPLLVFSLFVNFYATKSASLAMSNPVSDIILSNFKVIDVELIYVYGGVMSWALILLLALLKPQRIPLLTKSVALFVLIRAVFINLTHIAVFPSYVVIDPTKYFGLFSYYGDLFFSGHVGLPFLMALLFWENKRWRASFLLISVFFAFVVLLGHIHYSIDVFGAYFITFSIYHLIVKLFKKDKVLFDSVLQPSRLSKDLTDKPN